MNSYLSLFDIVKGLVLAAMAIAGSLAALGVVPVTSRVEAEHPLNRRMGLFWLLFGLGFLGSSLGQFVNLDMVSLALRVAIMILSGLLMVVGIWIGLRTMMQLRKIN
jgi:hypothetical protein